MIKTINAYAFANCTGLKKINVNMTEEFENVTKGTDWNLNIPVHITYKK